MNKSITVETIVKKDIDVVWEFWNEPKHIENWMYASSDWECPKAVNDVRVGGRFSFTLASKDKTSSFDFSGIYTAVEEKVRIAYTIDDGRKVEILFSGSGSSVKITETFEMENENSEELQRGGWQAILDNFKLYAEGQS